MKICNKCQINKPLQEFALHNQRKDGRHLTCKTCRNTIAKTKFDPIKQRIQSLKKEYDITVEQWEIMFKNQQGRCLICDRHQSEFKKRLHTDHNHVTGKVRGLLCAKCNHDLAAVENTEWLNKAMVYLKKDG